MALLQCFLPGINYLDKCQNSSKNSLLTSSITKIMKLLVMLDKSLKLLKGCFLVDITDPLIKICGNSRVISQFTQFPF